MNFRIIVQTDGHSSDDQVLARVNELCEDVREFVTSKHTDESEGVQVIPEFYRAEVTALAPQAVVKPLEYDPSETSPKAKPARKRKATK